MWTGGEGGRGEGKTTTTVAKHPAKYSDKFIPIFAGLLKDCRRILDFNAGTCKIVQIRDHGFDGEIVCLELEAPWAEGGRDKLCTVVVGNAERMPFLDGYFDGAGVSVVYGNRMSDHFNPKDGSKRTGYKFALGRDLTEGNTGKLHFTGKRATSLRYCTSYKRQYTELWRVLEDGAPFVLNISDHIREGRRARATLWHILCLKNLGFELVEHHRIKTPRNRRGANGDKRVEYESILVMRKG